MKIEIMTRNQIEKTIEEILNKKLKVVFQRLEIYRKEIERLKEEIRLSKRIFY